MEEKTPKVAIKNILDSILKTEVADPTRPMFSQFKKPIRKIKEEAKRHK